MVEDGKNDNYGTDTERIYKVCLLYLCFIVPRNDEPSNIFDPKMNEHELFGLFLCLGESYCIQFGLWIALDFTYCLMLWHQHLFSQLLKWESDFWPTRNLEKGLTREHFGCYLMILQWICHWWTMVAKTIFWSKIFYLVHDKVYTGTQDFKSLGKIFWDMSLPKLFLGMFDACKMSKKYY